MFKKYRDKLLEKYYQQRQTRDGEPEEDKEQEQEEINEEMALIEEKIRQIKEFNSRNFEVDEGLLKQCEGFFDQYDEEIVNAPFIEYTQDNPPPYLKNIMDGGLFLNGQSIAYTSLNKRLD